MAIYLLLFSKVLKLVKNVLKETVGRRTGRQDQGQIARVTTPGPFKDSALSNCFCPQIAICQVTVCIILTQRTK